MYLVFDGAVEFSIDLLDIHVTEKHIKEVTGDLGVEFKTFHQKLNNYRIDNGLQTSEIAMRKVKHNLRDRLSALMKSKTAALSLNTTMKAKKSLPLEL